MKIGEEVQEEDIEMFLLYLHSSTYFDDLVPEKKRERETAGKRQERRKRVRRLREVASRLERHG